jgi:DNA-binding NarL/FixJ family response regulator
MAKIILVEDHAVVRKGLKMVLGEAGHEVVAEAGDGDEAVEAAKANDFDLIIMDFSLPAQNGLEASEKIREIKPDAKIVILTMYDQAEYIRAAVEANVNGFILKSSNDDELFNAIAAVCDGKKYFDPKAADQLFEVATEQTVKAVISKREREVLKLAAEGLTNKEIASRLGIGMYTVRDHLRNVYEKLEVSDRAQAVATAMRQNLIS